MPTSTPTRRRRFRFSLRTMIVAVTLAAVFIGYHVNWIHERRAVADARKSTWCRSLYFSDIDRIIKPRPCAPGLLWLFGECGVVSCTMFFGYEPKEHFTYHNRDLTPLEEAEVSRIKRLFPEAEVDAEAYIIDLEFIQRFYGDDPSWHKPDSAPQL